MSVFDLHPEDLLDREAAGELLEHERALLEAHVHHCVACRLERQVRKDFALELDAELPSHTGALVTRALESQQAPEKTAAEIANSPEKQAQNDARVEPAIHAETDIHHPHENDNDDASASRAPSYRARAMRRRMGAAIIAAAVLMAASVAVAARGSSVWTAIFAPAPVETEEPSPTTPAPEMPKKHARNGRNANAHDSKIAPNDSDETADEFTPIDVPVTSPVVAPVVAPTAAPTACAPIPEPVAPTLVNAHVPIAHVDDSPATEFQDANTARRRGDHVAAARLYRDLVEKHAGSAEAPAARIALGRMLLDDGDAEGALGLFRDYLAGPDAALREEAMDGRARALERMHRADEERVAWDELLASYPASVHKAHAGARLEELSKH